MTGYVRPAIASREFYDASGNVISYGDRWGFEPTPDDAYGVTSNLERFGPLHAVADALIAHFVDVYEVTVTEDAAFARDILHTRTDVLRAVRVVPRGPDTAPLTFVFTSFPSVIVHAGAMHDFLFPVCGCDACDEGWEYQADEMEWQLRAIAAGGYEERVWDGAELGVTMSLRAADGSARMSGETRVEDFPADRLAEARARLKRLPGGWSKWSRRTQRAN